MPKQLGDYHSNYVKIGLTKTVIQQILFQNITLKFDFLWQINKKNTQLMLQFYKQSLKYFC